MALKYTFNEAIWLYHGDGAWYFITLPVEYADEIEQISSNIKRGFGSIKVSATIGSTTWNTSIFPDSKSKSYLLPIKKEIRAKNNLIAGQKPEVSIRIVGIQ